MPLVRPWRMRDRVFGCGRQLTNVSGGGLMHGSIRLVGRGQRLVGVVSGVLLASLGLRNLLDQGSAGSIRGFGGWLLSVFFLLLALSYLVNAARVGVRADRIGCRHTTMSAHFWNSDDSVPWCKVVAIEVEKLHKKGTRSAPVLVITNGERLQLSGLAPAFPGSAAAEDRVGRYVGELDRLRRTHVPCVSCQKSAAVADRELAALHSRVDALERQLEEHLGK